MKYLLTFAFLKLLLIPQIGYALDFSCMDAEWVNVSISSNAPSYNDTALANTVNEVLNYIEGTFGAVVMLGCGLLALLLSGCVAVGSLRRRYLLGALVFLILAVGIFVLRSFLGTFFNDNGGACIVEGTLIDTPSGQVPVESLQVGSLVISRDDSGQAVVSEIVALSEQVGPSALQFETESEGILNATHPHLVLTDDGWQPACSLQPGSRVATISGFELIVKAKKLDQEVRTFELSTSPVHNFIAGGVVVHDIKG